MNDTVGKLEFLSPRSAFKHEAHDFTVWMQDNIDALSNRLNVKLTVIEREAKAGGFNVDLLCEDEEGNRVIVENQLEESNHSHLGQLLTYLVNLEAKTAIWVTPKPRQEHEYVIDWLNKYTPIDISFYLVKVEIVRIGESPQAPLFTIISRPDPQTKQLGEKKKEMTERRKALQEFWVGLAAEFNQHAKAHKITPGSESWVYAGASGRSGVTFNCWLQENESGVQLYIDFDKETGEKNKLIYDSLFAVKDEIETEMGQNLRWWRLDDKRASIITVPVAVMGWKDRDDWSKIQKDMTAVAIKYQEVMRKRLKNIVI